VLLTLPACEGKETQPAAGAETGDQASSSGASASTTAQAGPSDSGATISFEDVATYPRPGTVLPGAVAFAPGDTHLTYLHSGDASLSRQLYKMDLADGKQTLAVEPPGGGVKEEELSLEEKLRRERSRSRGLGITKYSWSKEGERMLLPIAGDLYVRDGLDGELTTILDRKAWCETTGCDAAKPAIDAKFSRDGSKVGFVFDDEVYTMDAKAGAKPTQVTKGARGTGKTNGLAEYIAQEEMGRRSGYWWSRDASKIAFIEVDETHIPVYRIVHQGSDGVGKGHEEDHHYPFAGADNAKVRLGVVSAKGGATKWMDLTIPENGYLARVQWMPDGSLTAQVQNREQSELTLYRLDPSSGKATQLLQEKSEVWINLHNMLRGLSDEAGELAGHFVWASEKTGFQHLYLHDASGKEVLALTEGEWMVEGIVDIDEKAKKLWFMGTKASPLERHLFEVGLDGKGLRQVTQRPGSHGVTLDHAHQTYIDTLSSPAGPPTITQRKLADDSEVRAIFAAKDDKIAKLGLTAPEFTTVKTSDGATLHGAIYKPDPARFGPGPYPTMVSVYGGPHAQRVSQSWGMTVDMRAQALRDRGYLVFKLDNRGSARRGLAFEGAIKHNMGDLEVKDQADGVRYLVEQGLTDPARVGIYGWSYGGYMSAIALMRAPETFKVGISGAPVTHWDGYDTHYTERYMGTPTSNPEGYKVSAVMEHVDKLSGHLLLVHGLIDENVHFRHTARLIQALIKAKKDYELLMFPKERHMPRALEDRVYMEQRIFDYIGKHL
jgi:dipeptidyl-peptidase-4